ncbi:MAG: response regulator, partial [Acidimicrobiia bacterium]|nr:response regulator [Acidimicrobiia bacterium]
MVISVFLADDNLIVREGVRALLDLEEDFDVVGQAADYDGLVAGARDTNPQVIVTDIRMPPDFSREGIEAAKEVRRRHPGTGVVILSQFDDPDYAVSLLSEGAAGYAYLLKDRVGEEDQLARAVREVAAGGSVLDPKIVEALTTPVRAGSSLTPGEEALLQDVAEGRTINAIATQQGTTPAAVNTAIEALFGRLAEGLTAGNADSLERLKMLQRAIVDRKEQGESLSRLLPGGVAAQILEGGHHPGETVELTVTVLMSDIRGYTSIAEKADPSVLAGQLNEHRAAMNQAIVGQGGTVMQYVGDAVMAVFGAPIPLDDHAERAVAAATAMQAAQAEVNNRWEGEGRAAFGLGIGLSTGPVAAALLGSEQRLEYTVVGDTVNLTQRLQQWAQPGETVLSEPTMAALESPPDCDVLEP